MNMNIYYTSPLLNIYLYMFLFPDIREIATKNAENGPGPEKLTRANTCVAGLKQNIQHPKPLL
jgi:hypothetical protein